MASGFAMINPRRRLPDHGVDRVERRDDVGASGIDGQARDHPVGISAAIDGRQVEGSMVRSTKHVLDHDATRICMIGPWGVECKLRPDGYFTVRARAGLRQSLVTN